MYKVKRFSSKNLSNKKKDSKVVDAISTGGLFGLGGAAVAIDQANKEFKIDIDKAYKRVADGVIEGKYDPTMIGRMRHPKTLENFSKIRNSKLKKAALIGGSIGSGLGVGLSVLSNKKSNKSPKRN